MTGKRTKIVATIGPASSRREVLAAMVRAGADVFRLNFSHANRGELESAVRHVRSISEQTGANLALLQDLPGPKVRLGRFRGGETEIERGQTFDLLFEEVEGDTRRASISYTGLGADVDVGQAILLDDGKLRLRVTAIESHRIATEVEVGGGLTDLKGVNVPGVELSLDSLTEQDLAALELGVDLDVDWVAQSFVRNAADVERARQHLRRLDSPALLMAKIETPVAVTRFEEILAAADGVMIARGDLGVEMPPEEVPVVQKLLVEKAHQAGKPVITATQMLESMISSARPTRAETSDVANAIFDGTDAVMLSAETAIGRYPVESVEMMTRVAGVVEGSPAFEDRRRMLRAEAAETTPDAIAKAACEVAETLAVKAVLVFTTSGSSALRIARNRPGVPVLALTPNPKVRAALALTFGVRAELAPGVDSADEMVEVAMRHILRHELAEPGERIVITAGVPFGIEGTTNLVWVARVD